MSSSQDIRPSQDLPPNEYRETLIYSNPRSPMLSPAYFSDEESCYQCQPIGSECDELCILSEYEDMETKNSNSQASLVGYTEALDADRIESVQTSPTSFASPEMSKLFIRCQGESVPANVATWTKWRSRHWSKDGVSEAALSLRENNIEYEEYPREGWFDSESSQSSCSSRYGDVLDVRMFLYQVAFVQKLS